MFFTKASHFIWSGALVVVFLVSVGCGYDGPKMTVQELKAAVDDSKREITVVDVRPQIQFDKGHVSGALNHPLEGFEKSFETIASTKGEVAIICTCGKRSSTIC